MHRTGKAPLLAGLLAAAGAAAAAEPAVVEEHVLTRLVRLPVLFREQRPGGCPDPSAAQLERAREALTTTPLDLDEAELDAVLGAWLGDVPAARAFRAGETWLAQQVLAEESKGSARPRRRSSGCGRCSDVSSRPLETCACSAGSSRPTIRNRTS
jgi:hypothetical protein